jgi:hypothetical protein
MANRTLLAFRRRHNEDGTWDSICLRCYRTAASARDASWLPLLQSAHICDPMDLHAWMSDRELFGVNQQDPHQFINRFEKLTSRKPTGTPPHVGVL